MQYCKWKSIYRRFLPWFHVNENTTPTIATINNLAENWISAALSVWQQKIQRIQFAEISVSTMTETDNVWRPSVLEMGQRTENEDFFMKFRCILNKLTLQKFDTLVEQVKKMDFNSEVKLKGAVALLFDKAVDEPLFCGVYAKLCYSLSRLSVQGSKSDTKGKVEKFVLKTVLIQLCQQEFERVTPCNLRHKKQREELLNDIACAVGEKRKELENQLEEQDRRMRKRYVGVHRFNGELYKINLLNSNIMVQCICKLLDKNDEELLECLCKLITTIGQHLETTNERDRNPVDLEPQIKIMKQIVTSRQTSLRIRFMLQDVIDLRENNWKPRRSE